MSDNEHSHLFTEHSTFSFLRLELTNRLDLFPALHIPSFHCLQCEMKAGSGRGREEAT